MPQTTKPPPLKTRKPTGKMPWPMLVFAGGEKTGKTYAAIEGSTSQLVHRTLLLEVGESYGDAYASIPGADYEIVEHDGSWRDIYNQLWAATTQDKGPNGEPNLVILDSGSMLWDLIVNDLQATANARRKKDDADITMDLWNRGKKRWAKIVDLLRFYDGPSIITARYDEVTVVENGKPTQRTEWKVRAEKNLPYDADGVVEWREPRKPRVTRIRSTKRDFGTGDGVNLPPQNMWHELMTMLGVSQATTEKRDYIPPAVENLDTSDDDGQGPDPRFAHAQRIFDDAVAAESVDDIAALGRSAKEQGLSGYPVDTGDDGRQSLQAALLALYKERDDAQPPAQESARERADDGARPAQETAQETAQEPAPPEPPAAHSEPPRKAPEPGPSPRDEATADAKEQLMAEAHKQAQILDVPVTKVTGGKTGVAGLQAAVIGNRAQVIAFLEQSGDTEAAQRWGMLPARPVLIDNALEAMGMRLAKQQAA